MPPGPLAVSRVGSGSSYNSRLLSLLAVSRGARFLDARWWRMPVLSRWSDVDFDLENRKHQK